MRIKEFLANCDQGLTSREQVRASQRACEETRRVEMTSEKMHRSFGAKTRLRMTSVGMGLYLVVLSVLFATSSRYLAGTARNQISNPNKISAPRTENSVCRGWN